MSFKIAVLDEIFSEAPDNREHDNCAKQLQIKQCLKRKVKTEPVDDFVPVVEAEQPSKHLKTSLNFVSLSSGKRWFTATGKIMIMAGKRMLCLKTTL